jgi:hypothetical protein
LTGGCRGGRGLTRGFRLTEPRHDTATSTHDATGQSTQHSGLIHALSHRTVKCDVLEGGFGQGLRQFLEHALGQGATAGAVEHAKPRLCGPGGQARCDHLVNVADAQRFGSLGPTEANGTTDDTRSSGQRRLLRGQKSVIGFTPNLGCLHASHHCAFATGSQSASSVASHRGLPDSSRLSCRSGSSATSEHRRQGFNHRVPDQRRIGDGHGSLVYDALGIAELALFVLVGFRLESAQELFGLARTESDGTTFVLQCLADSATCEDVRNADTSLGDRDDTLCKRKSGVFDPVTCCGFLGFTCSFFV